MSHTDAVETSFAFLYKGAVHTFYGCVYTDRKGVSELEGLVFDSKGRLIEEPPIAMWQVVEKTYDLLVLEGARKG